MALSAVSIFAQQYTGISGLVQTPSADMYNSGDARIGAYYLDNSMLPAKRFTYYGKPYNTADFYIALTPFSWLEMSYSIVLMKGVGGESKKRDVYQQKDQSFSLKVRPLREGRYWPGIALGCNDPFTTGGSQYFSNFYAAATKHVEIHKHELGATIAYRRYVKAYNKKWNGFSNSRWDGVTAGITYSPAFYRPLRAVVEWTGAEINVGLDCLLWKHLMVQVALIDRRHFSGGLAYTLNLF